MTRKIDNWENITAAQAEADVFNVQRRIFHASVRGDHAAVHKLQIMLTNSRSARWLAVHRVAQENRGKRTPGVDGLKNPSPTQRRKLASGLRLDTPTQPLRRIQQIKPNGKIRPISIPTIEDRARQTLIAMALGPQWEPRFPLRMYGFRKGRSVHDAIESVRRYIERTPRWVLDADIKAFFDNISRKVFMKKLDTHPRIRWAIRNMLRSGVVENFKWYKTEKGVPQGSTLSTLIGNIILSGIEDDLAKVFPKNRKINGQAIKDTPRIVVYADDIKVLHERRDVIEEVKTFLTRWLADYGLGFNEEKTQTVHSLEGENGTGNFDFLGCTITQRRTGKRQINAWYKGVRTHVSPKAATIQALKEKVSKVIDETKPNPKGNAANIHKLSKGALTHQEQIIHKLNPILRGWANHFRYHNSKRTFAEIDHWLWKKLMKWSIRHYGKKMPRGKLVNQFFNGGSPWIFKAKNPTTGKPTELMKLSSVKVSRKDHKCVRADASYYGESWLYWTRIRGRYPGIKPTAAKAMQRQHGRCHKCRQVFQPGEHLTVVRKASDNAEGQTSLILHTACMIPSDKEGGTEPIGIRCRDRQ